MSHYLFIFTIGPVQSFIAQARKTQDLYAGSQLLSDLIRFAFQEAERNSEYFTLIFPYSDAVSMPNRFVALLSPQEDIKTFGNNLRASLKDHLSAIAKKAMGDSLYEIAALQISDFLEAYWAAIPYDRSLTNTIYEDGKTYYQRKMGELERVLGGVKNYRDYSQFAEEPGRKCSVNGYYNALFYQKTDNEVEEKRDPKATKHLAKSAVYDTEIDISKLDKGEGISGVTLMRRYYKDKPSFPAVSRIALTQLIDHLRNEPEMIRFLLPFGGLSDFNEQLFYEENLTKNSLDANIKIKTNYHEVLDAYQNLKNKAKKNNLKFLKYYAIIVFDADNMGQHFSNCKAPEEHTELSKALSDFAKWAREYVDAGRGITVYAGGDDYVGMLNLTTLFETVETLRREFGERFNEQSMAFSAGIAIAHYKTPLGEVMNYARNMEKKAKERDGKNAFGIVVMKHSGEILETVLPWQSVKEQEIWNTSLLRDIHEKLKDGVSAAFIKNLNEELHIWDENPEGFRPQSEYEIRRLILRAKGQVSGEDAEYLAQKVQKLYAQVQTKGEEGTNIFLRALSIIDFLNRKIS